MDLTENLGDVTHDAVDGLGLAVLLRAPLDVLLAHPPLGQVDVTLVPDDDDHDHETEAAGLLIDPDHDDRLGPAHPDQLVDGPNSPSGGEMVMRAVCSVQCAVCSEQCAVCSEQCAVCSVQ